MVDFFIAMLVYRSVTGLVVEPLTHLKQIWQPSKWGTPQTSSDVFVAAGPPDRLFSQVSPGNPEKRSAERAKKSNTGVLPMPTS